MDSVKFRLQSARIDSVKFRLQAACFEDMEFRLQAAGMERHTYRLKEELHTFICLISHPLKTVPQPVSSRGVVEAIKLCIIALPKKCCEHKIVTL
ncbi:MAG: hypothetical protein HY231_25135 [Acidobacteria bacterium]|nr:hypothetical protein [Acidobacteriota bacterium]